MTIPEELQEVLTSTPDTLGGEVRFAGTRVPVAILLDYLAEGSTERDFLEGYPTVRPEQVRTVVAWSLRMFRERLGLAS